MKPRKEIPIRCGKCGKVFALNKKTSMPNARILDSKGLMIRPINKKPSDPLHKGVYAVVCDVPSCKAETLIDGARLFGPG